jgi:acyl carrier protein
VIEIPPLKTQWVELRPVMPTDYPWLYDQAVTPEHAYRWRFRAQVPSYEEFVRLLTAGVLVQYMVIGADSRRLGLVVCYRADFRNRNAYVAIQASAEFIHRGWVLQAASLFVNYLFTCYDFDKLYAEHYEFTFDGFRSGLDRYFVQEACFKDHERFMGQTWDLHVVAYYRSTWMERASRGQIALGHGAPAYRDEPLNLDDFATYLETELELTPGTLSTQATRFTDLGFDSIRMVELLAAIDDLGVELSDEALAEIRTLDDAYFHYLQGQRASSAI